jgi:hypothetical protein
MPNDYDQSDPGLAEETLVEVGRCLQGSGENDEDSPGTSRGGSPAKMYFRLSLVPQASPVVCGR